MNTTTLYTQEQVNRALFVVCTTQFKKDAKTEHDIVKDAGYTIKKWDGQFHVENKATGKILTIDYSYSYRKRGGFYWFNDRKNDAEKADLINYLDTPYNKAWHVRKDYEWSFENKRYGWKKAGTVSGAKLKDARWDVSYHAGEIEKIKQQIEQLQNSIEYHVAQKTKAELNLANLKKELGLTK